MKNVNIPKLHSPWLIPAGVLLLCVLLQIACATGASSTTAPDTSTNTSSQPMENGDQDINLSSESRTGTILLRSHPRAEVELVDPVRGERQAWFLAQTGDVRTVLAAQHLLFAGWLIDQDGHYYQLPTGIPSPDARWLVEENKGLKLRQVDGAGERLLSAAGHTPLWSPDSQVVAFVDESGIHMAVVSDGAITQLINDPVAIPIAWSPDHQSLLIQIANQLSIQEVASGQLHSLALQANQLHGQPVWSQDGQTLYLRYGRSQSMQIAGAPRVLASLISFDLESNSQQSIVASRNGEGVLDFALAPDEESVVVWFATCRLTISQLVPIPVRSCTHELRLASTTDSAARPLTTLASDTAQFTAPHLGWLAWQPPIQLALDSPMPESPPTVAESQVMTMAPIEIPLVPFGETASGGVYHFGIQRVLMGTDALTYAEQSALTTQIQQPVPGYTQVVVLLQGRTDSGNVNLSGRSIKAVGQEGTLYQAELLVGANGREGNNKQISMRTADGEQTLGFVFVVPENEVLQALYIRVPGVDLPPFFLALSDEAVITLPTAPPLPPNSFGIGKPAPVNTTVVAHDWEITFLPTESDDDTAAALQQQYLSTEGGLAIKARIRYTGEGLDGTTNGCWEFVSAFSGLDDSMVITVPYRVLPNFTTLQYLCLLPGGFAEGWLLIDAPTVATPSIVVTLPDTRPPELRYFAVR